MNTDVLVSAPDFNSGTGEGIVFSYFSGGVEVDYSFFFYPPGPGKTFVDLEAAVVAAVNSYATTKGYIVDSLTWWFPGKATSSNDGLMSAADKVKLDAIVNASIGPATRALNTAFRPSVTRNTIVNYSVDITTSVSLSGGAVGTVFLEYADDSAFTTNVVEMCRFVNGNTGTLVIGLTLDQTVTAPLGGYVPAGKYVRLRTANITGTPTFTYRSGQEVLA